MAREMADMGFGPDDVARFRADKARAARVAPPPIVWPDMVPVVELFAALTTQWRRTVVAGAAGAVVIVEGLRYEAIPVVMAMLGLEPSRALLADLGVMEDAAIAAMCRR